MKSPSLEQFKYLLNSTSRIEELLMMSGLSSKEEQPVRSKPDSLAHDNENSNLILKSLMQKLKCRKDVYMRLTGASSPSEALQWPPEGNVDASENTNMEHCVRYEYKYKSCSLV